MRRLSLPPAFRAFAQLPTPVEPAAWLDTKNTTTWVKRDDRSSPLYGGGKVRKLEWILANSPWNDARPLVSMGGIGSNHLVALALFLRLEQRKLHALVFDQALTDHARTNLAVLASLDTRFWASRTRVGIGKSWLAYRLWARPEEPGVDVAAGASSPLGSFGFVEAGLELAAQIEAGELPKPDRIYISAGSAGSSAGLALGLGLAGVSTHLRLISAVEPLFFNSILFRLKLGAIWAELRRRRLENFAGVSAARLLANAGVGWSIDHSQVGRGYAQPTAQGTAMVERAAEHGLHLETTYTGKCVAGLMRDADRGTLRAGTQVLFWNTHGGQDLSAHTESGWEQRLPPGLRRRLDL